MGKRVLRSREGYGVELLFEDGAVHSRRVQHDREDIMRRNADLQRTDGAVRDWTFGRLALDIPLADMPALNKFFPGIADPGHPDHKWQLRKFLESPASKPYRVTDTKRPNAGHIVVT